MLYLGCIRWCHPSISKVSPNREKWSKVVGLPAEPANLFICSAPADSRHRGRDVWTWLFWSNRFSFKITIHLNQLGTHGFWWSVWQDGILSNRMEFLVWKWKWDPVFSRFIWENLALILCFISFTPGIWMSSSKTPAEHTNDQTVVIVSLSLDWMILSHLTACTIVNFLIFGAYFCWASFFLNLFSV